MMPIRSLIDRVPSDENWNRLRRVVDQLRDVVNDLQRSGELVQSAGGFTATRSTTNILAGRVFDTKVAAVTLAGSGGASDFDDWDVVSLARVFGHKTSMGSVG